jgi:outer membrane protein assembly factor BamB
MRRIQPILAIASAAAAALGLLPAATAGTQMVRHVSAARPGSGTRSGSAGSTPRARTARMGDAMTYQIDPRHDGDQAVGTLSTRSLKRRWKVTLGRVGSDGTEAGDVSYPVIADNRIFVTVESPQASGTRLYALSARTGAVEWSASLGSLFAFSALAYDKGRIFAVNDLNRLFAFAAGTGHRFWSVRLPGQLYSSSPPTAYDGVVYVSGEENAGTLYAVSEATGAVKWKATVENGENSSPAVDASGVYVSYACQQDYRFSLRGQLVWHHTTGCEGGGGSTAVIADHSLYSRADGPPPIILSKSSGEQTGTFTSQTAPAFDSNAMFTLQAGRLVAGPRSGGPRRWSFGHGALVTAPVVSGSVVFEGSSNGTVYGVSASTGAQVWSAKAGSRIVGVNESTSVVLVGMAVGDGLLVVPAGTALTAFGG